MPPVYRLWLRDNTGVRRAVVDGYDYLQYTRRLNAPDSFEIHLPADHWTITAGHWQLDGELHILRRPEGAADWQEETSCLVRYYRDYHEGAEHKYTSIGRGALQLLNRRLIVPPTGQAYDSAGPDPADVVLHHFVDSHAGPGAGSRVLPGLYVAAAGGLGNQIQEEARYYKLGATVAKLAAAGAIDFDIVPVFGAAMETWADIQSAGQQYRAQARYGWLFRTHYPYFGLDRQRGNSAGNAPTIFALTRGNMQNPAYVYDATEIGNDCYVLGQGTEENRQLVRVVDGASVGLSAWNDWEYQRDARNSSAIDTLIATGRAENEAQRAREEFGFTSLEAPGCRYGVHWNLGDIATADYAGQSFAVRCIEVQVVLSGENPETVRATWRADL